MATTPTNKPIPSEDPRDLKFNAGKIDEVVTSDAHYYTDRFGVRRWTIAGFQYTAEEAIRNYGYITMDSFEDGATLTLPNQVLRYEATGEYYRWDGDFGTNGKVVPSGSTPETAGGVGLGAWVSVGDASLRSNLADSDGSSLIKYGDGTLKDYLDSLSNKSGFNAVGRFLNIAELREATPSTEGEMVFVASAYSTSVAESHIGGGYFEAINNTQAYTDDGGIIVKPDHPTLVWKRINFTSYDMQFWGVIADGSTDNAAAITRATQYAKVNRVILDAPAGSIHTSEMVPVYNNMGIRGHGKTESTVFYKTTNNPFDLKKNGITQLQIDALVGFIPNSWDLSDTSMNSFAVHCTLIGCMFRRYGLNQDNVGTIGPQYGLFLGKAASSVIRQVNVEGGRIGAKGFNTFSGVMEMVALVQYNGYGYAGVDISDFRGGIMYNSGTSMDMRLVQVRGYQFAFELDRLQYSTLINCTAEEIGPMDGETTSYAFSFYDPFCVTMIGCATEFVKGGQIRVQGFSNPSFRPSLKISGFIAIDQQNPVSPTPIFNVDNGGVTQMNIVIDASELSRDTTKSNLLAPVVSGLGAKVTLIGCSGEDWTSTASGVFTRLA